MSETELSLPAGLPVSARQIQPLRQRPRAIWLTLLLCLLTVAVLAVTRRAENRVQAGYHGWWHWETLEKSLLVQSVYENEPPSLRWLSGYFTPDSFYKEQNAFAMAAERDGYLTPSARNAMALVAHRAGDFAKAAYWREGPPDGIQGQPLAPESRNALLEWPTVARPEILMIISTSGGILPVADAGRYYWTNVRAVFCLLFLGIVLIPCGRTAARLLWAGNAAPASLHGGAAEWWQPREMLGGWLRADWLFGFSGLIFTTGYYVAWAMLSESMPPEMGSWKEQFPEAYLRFHSAVFTGWRRTLVTVVLMVGPVYLLARWFAGGVRGMWRRFGLNTAGISWRLNISRAAGATWIAMLALTLTWPVCLRMGWFDARDGWRFAQESLPSALFHGCLLAPLIEEMVFRGFLFGAFANRWPATCAALFSSLIFAGIHGYSWSGFVVVTAYGMLFCGLYRRTGSLWPGMLAHAMINLILALGLSLQ